MLNLQNFDRLRQKHENSAYFTSFALTNYFFFALILENFPQMWVSTSSGLRSSACPKYVLNYNADFTVIIYSAQ